MVGDVLPPGVRYADAYATALAAGAAVTGIAVDELFPEERSYIARAVSTRRRAFAEVRRCARRALAELDVGPVPLVPGDSGAPRWPAGIVGSMTHCPGYCAAAVGLARDFVAIGIDAEPNEPLPDGVLELVARSEDLAALRRLPADQGIAWDRLLFSAKESFYKAWSPIAHRFLDFHDAEVTLEVAGTFRGRLLVPAPSVAARTLVHFHGRWTVRSGVLATAVTVPAGAVAAAV